MASNSNDLNDVAIAWAMPVSLAQLGARLFAYVKTKAVITRFRLAALRGALVGGYCGLPPELVAMIAREVRSVVFNSEMKKWVKIRKCLKNTCTTLSHMGQEDYDEMASILTSSRSLHTTAEDIAGQAWDKHREDVVGYCEDLTNLKNNSELAKCVQIFIKDFAVHPYFVIERCYDEDECPPVSCSRAEAFLMLPLTQIPVVYVTGPGVAYFSIIKHLDPSVLGRLTKPQANTFETAAKVLDLHPYDPNEDEGMYEEKWKVQNRYNPNEGLELGVAAGNQDVDPQLKQLDIETDMGDGSSMSEEHHPGNKKTLAPPTTDEEDDQGEQDESTKISTPEGGKGPGNMPCGKINGWPKLMILGGGEIEALEPYQW